MATALATDCGCKILAKVVKLDNQSDLSRSLTSTFSVKYDYILNFMILFGNLDDIYFFFDNSIGGRNSAAHA